MVNLNYGFDVQVRTSKTDVIAEKNLEPRGVHASMCRGLGKALTVFLAEDDVILETDGESVNVEGAKYQYDDRILQQFGGEAVRRAYESAEEEVGNNNSAAYHEAALRKIYDDPDLELRHLLVGVSATEDRSYKVFGFISDIVEA